MSFTLDLSLRDDEALYEWLKYKAPVYDNRPAFPSIERLALENISGIGVRKTCQISRVEKPEDKQTVNYERAKLQDYMGFTQVTEDVKWWDHNEPWTETMAKQCLLDFINSARKTGAVPGKAFKILKIERVVDSVPCQVEVTIESLLFDDSAPVLFYIDSVRPWTTATMLPGFKTDPVTDWSDEA